MSPEAFANEICDAYMRTASVRERLELSARIAERDRVLAGEYEERAPDTERALSFPVAPEPFLPPCAVLGED